MAGAAKEMNEALLINPNSYDDFANTLKRALEMPEAEQKTRMKFLQKRLKRYDVEKWAKEFLSALRATRELQEVIVAKELTVADASKIKTDYNNAEKRLILLDYDGTLTTFTDNPQDAKPDDALFELLDTLQEDEKNNLVLISGRDKETFNNWFGEKSYNLVTDHGVWLRDHKEWVELERLKTDWMTRLLPILETFVDRTPGTFIERKNYSLAWHYRTADPELAQIRTTELKTVVTSMIANNDLSLLEGNKVMEIKSSNVNKGRATNKLLLDVDYDFILIIGDDWTDEYMFEEAPEFAYSIKVGYKKTKARYQIKSPKQVRELLSSLK
jgi:trehalose 6-phosphate synthase/phosphatase